MSTATRALAMAGLLYTAPVWSYSDEKANARDMFFAGLDAGSHGGGADSQKSSAHSRPGPNDRAHKPGSRIEVSTNDGRGTGVPAAFGLRYSVLKVIGPNMVEVSPKTQFRRGDRIQLKLQVNGDGYLYVVNQGSTGTWRLRHPKPGSAPGSNRVIAGNEYTIPDALMKFDANPGIERLFVVVSREPESTVEAIIHAIQDQSPESDRQTAGSQVSNIAIDDSVVSNLRRTYSRDLLSASAEDGSQRAGGDQASYVVSRNTRSDCRLVADIELVHR